MISTPIPKNRVDDRLTELGWDSVREYQDFHGLKPDGDAGPVTRRSMAGLRICKGPERMTGSQVCKWGKHDLKWHFSGRLPGLSDDEAKEAFRLATKYWEAVCDLRFQYVSQPGAADLLLQAGAIDTAGGTLAWQELPCGRDSQKDGMYDTRDTWTAAESPQRGRIDLVRVAAHELGHGIGIPHIASGNLLQPTYDLRIRRPQSGDIKEAQKRYGAPKDQPDPTEPPIDPGDGITLFDIVRLHTPAKEGDLFSVSILERGGG